VGIANTNAFKDRFRSIEQGVKTPAIIDTKKYTKGDGFDEILVIPPAPTWDELLGEMQTLTSSQGHQIYSNFLNHRVKKLYEDGQGAALVTAMQVAKETAKFDQIGMFVRMVSVKAGNWETMTIGTVRKLWSIRRYTREIIEKLKIDPKLTKYVLKRAWSLGSRIMACLSMATKEQGKGSSLKLFFWLISPKRQATATT
jgi:hypothetical protein